MMSEGPSTSEVITESQTILKQMVSKGESVVEVVSEPQIIVSGSHSSIDSMESTQNYYPLLIPLLLLASLCLVYKCGNNRYFKWLDSSLGAAFIAIFGAISAAQISVFSTQIKNQIVALDLGLEASFALIATYIFGVAVYLKEINQNERVSLKEQGIERQWRLQEQRLTSMPPNSILAALSITTIKARQIENLRHDKVEDGVATLLKRLCNLAEEWDGRSQENQLSKYNANLMLPVERKAILQHIENKTLDCDLEKSILSSPFFLFDDNLESRINSCDGVLVCYKKYSTAESEGSEPALVFPYVRKGNHLAKSQPVLFGAPKALVSGQPVHTKNTSDAADEFLKRLENDNVFFKKNFRNQIRSYYQDNEGSILSIPLESNKKVVAIINIYRQECDILRNGDRAHNFYHLVAPICHSIVKCLKNDLSRINQEIIAEDTSPKTNVEDADFGNQDKKGGLLNESS